MRLHVLLLLSLLFLLVIPEGDLLLSLRLPLLLLFLFVIPEGDLLLPSPLLALPVLRT